MPRPMPLELPDDGGAAFEAPEALPPTRPTEANTRHIQHENEKTACGKMCIIVVVLPRARLRRASR